MFILLKRYFILVSFIFLNACASVNLKSPIVIDLSNVTIETPMDKDNILFREHLIRIFKSKSNISKKFILKASISFTSSDTLSVSGLKKLSKTIAKVNYNLYDISSMKLIESVFIKSSPSIGSTSNSFYAKDAGIKQTKERLNMSTAKKMFLHLNILLRRLN